MGTLYLVATPIGNLEDITLRALRVLREVRLIAAEDTRHTRKLLAHHHIPARLLSYHEHNKAARVAQVLAALSGGDVALVSDAGTPGLSDPGYELVNAALQAGHTVCPVPGPSAVTAALVASGLPTDSFVFLGYLPRQAGERRRLLATLAGEQRTMVAFEAPHRLRSSLKDLARAFGEARLAAVCREVTKVHEEFLRGTLGELTRRFAEQVPRGEITLVIAGARLGPGVQRPRWSEARVRRALNAKRAEGLSLAAAARHVAEISGWSRREVYRLSREEA